MNSDRRILAPALIGLVSIGACYFSRQAPKPPTFPGGGLIARSAPVPNPYSLENALEGVYNTSSRFGSDVVVHASQWGSVERNVNASVAILGFDHMGIALMQPGCFTGKGDGGAPFTALVLEGYWRYFDDSDPNPSTTGLVRLFVQPQAVVDYVCNAPVWPSDAPPGDPRPLPGGTCSCSGRPCPCIQAQLTGATGSGENEPGDPLTVTWVGARKSRSPPDGGPPTFLVGVHHGGCQTTDNCGVSENTPESTILATQLGGGYMEIDTHLTKDKVPVFFHLSLNPGVTQGIYCTGQVEDYTYAELLADCRLRNGEVIPRVDEMIASILARTNFPMYLDSKSPDVIVPVSQILGKLADDFVPCNPPPPDAGGGPWPPAGKQCLFPGSAPVWQRGVIGLPDSTDATTYQEALDGGMLAPNQHCLIEEESSEVDSIPCVSWMPRYTRGPMTGEVLTLQQSGHFVGFWTINDPATLDAFLTTAVPNGILTNYPGLLNQRFEMVGTPPPYLPTLTSTP